MTGYRRRGSQLTSLPARGEAARRRAPRSASSSVFAALVSLLFVSVAAVPHSSSLALADDGGTTVVALGAQSFRVSDAATATESERSGYGVTLPPPEPKAAAAPIAGRPDPGSAKAIAYDIVLAKGWSERQYDCLVALWDKESGWNVSARNPSSGAYGIPQALPGEKMASAGADWRTNPETQIKWGLGYVEGRYGTPCGAWESSQTRGWY